MAWCSALSGTCAACLCGQQHAWDRQLQLGFTLWGCFAELAERSALEESLKARANMDRHQDLGVTVTNRFD